MANKLELMKIAEAFDGEFDIADFSEEELCELVGRIDESDSPEEIRRKYFEFYDDIKDRVLDRHKWSD